MEVIAKKSDVTEHVLLSKPMGLINPWQAGILAGVSAKTRSDWMLLTRVVAKALRFTERNGKKIEGKVVAPSELEKAENFIIREVQIAYYKDEYESLAKGDKIKNHRKSCHSPHFTANKRE